MFSTVQRNVFWESYTIARKPQDHTFYGSGIKRIKDSKERLFIRIQTHNLQIFRVIPVIKLQNDT